MFILLCWLSAYGAFAQDFQNANYADITGSIGSNQGSFSVDYFHLWRFTQSKKVEIGLGARFTSYFGSTQYYSSAPASLAGDKSKTDSLLLQSPQVNSFNVAINLGYRLSSKIGVGFNIDALGFSFGGKQNGSYIKDNQGQPTPANPTAFNLLLVGYHDKGTLNSEFYLRYFFKENLAIKLAFQHLFTEYTADTQIQQVPEANDRFRNISNLFSLGISKQF